MMIEICAVALFLLADTAVGWMYFRWMRRG
jgi:hypothetical protein